MFRTGREEITPLSCFNCKRHGLFSANKRTSGCTELRFCSKQNERRFKLLALKGSQVDCAGIGGESLTVKTYPFDQFKYTFTGGNESRSG